MVVEENYFVDKSNKMSEIIRLLIDEKKSRPWDRKLGNRGSHRVYTVDMAKDGSYEVIESTPNSETHHAKFANEADAEAWAAYRRDSAAYRRKSM
jgi:hypothetical protein